MDEQPQSQPAMAEIVEVPEHNERHLNLYVPELTAAGIRAFGQLLEHGNVHPDAKVLVGHDSNHTGTMIRAVETDEQRRSMDERRREFEKRADAVLEMLGEGAGDDVSRETGDDSRG